MKSRGGMISLKWKTMALLALALATANASLLLIDYRWRLGEQTLSQHRESHRKLTVLERLLQNSEERLQRIGHIVPTVMESPGAPDATDLWTTLQLELNLEVMDLFQADGSILLSGHRAGGTAEFAPVRERIRQALANDAPDQFLICQDSCLHYVLAPTFGPHGQPRLLVMAQPLIDLVLQFPGLSSADIALFAPIRSDQRLEENLLAVSNAPANRPLLETLLRDHQLDSLTTGRTIEFEQRSLRLTAYPWERFGGIGNGFLLIFEDVTESLQQIRDQFHKSLMSALAATLVAMLLGLAILNRPMNQLRRLADALPLLPAKAYDAARLMIGEGHRSRRFPTEIELLESQTIRLADQLEALEDLVDKRSIALAEKVAELRHSEDFNHKILSTAPVLIMVLTGDGHITDVNEFACTLLGFGKRELTQRQFLDLVSNRRQSREAHNAIVDLVAGRRQIYETAAHVRCVDGGNEHISLLLTRVTAQGGVFLLCIGLPDTASGANAQLDSPDQAPATAQISGP